MKRFWILLMLLILALQVSCSAAERMPVETDVSAAEGMQETGSEPQTVLYDSDQRLGYDKESRTFYCTIGTDNRKIWPEISLTAECAQGSRIVFLEDYTKENCRTAVRDGSAFRMAEIRDDGYSVFYLVFTGLPQILLDTDGSEIGQEYIPAQFTASGKGYELTDSGAQVHLHGGTYYRGIDKWSYRVELRDEDSGKKKDASVLGLPEDSDWLLLGNSFDNTCIKNQVCWELWRDWNNGEGVTMLDGRMAELFINDEYMGLYQLFQRIRPKKEIPAMGGSLDSAVVIRKMLHDTDRPSRWIDGAIGGALSYRAELRYAPDGMSEEEAFAVFQDWFDMDDAMMANVLDDETFARKVLEHFDMKELMSYFLFIQVCQLGMDNVNNNVYIWATLNEDGTYHYRLSPWDLDSAYMPIDTDGNKTSDECNLWMTMCTRILNGNIGGARDALWDLWNEKRSSLIADGEMTDRIQRTADVINASGAYRRDHIKWYDEDVKLNPKTIIKRAETHLSTIAYYMAELWPRGKK